MSTLLGEKAVREEADRFLVVCNDKLPDAAGCAVIFTLERSELLLPFHKPADLLRV